MTPGSYQRVVCIGAGALRLYSYIGDVSLLCGVEDIDNETLSERPKMFDSVARPYVLAHSDMFASLPSCGVGGPNAQSPEAEKILTCEPDIVISLYGDADKANALQEQLGVPVVTLMTGPDSVFDESFNETGFDTEYCTRLDRRGYSLIYAPNVVMKYHGRIHSVADADGQDRMRYYDTVRDTLIRGDPRYNNNFDYALPSPRIAVRPRPAAELNELYRK